MSDGDSDVARLVAASSGRPSASARAPIVIPKGASKQKACIACPQLEFTSQTLNVTSSSSKAQTLAVSEDNGILPVDSAPSVLYPAILFDILIPESFFSLDDIMESIYLVNRATASHFISLSRARRTLFRALNADIVLHSGSAW